MTTPSWSCALQVTLEHFSLDVMCEGGKGAVALIGPNGAGKTTLLRTIAGAYTPTQGRINVAGRTWFDSVEGIELSPEHRGVGYVPQGYGLFPHMCVLDNVAFGLLAKGLSKKAREKRAMTQLTSLGCAHLCERLPDALSGGEAQRIALARALIAEPLLLLLDEPLAAMDIVARRSLRVHLSDYLATQETPVLMATHDVRDVLALCDRAIVLEAGRIVQSGTTNELQTEPATEFVTAFFEGI